MNKQKTRVRGFLIRSLTLSDRKSKIQKLQQARREFKNKSGKNYKQIYFSYPTKKGLGDRSDRLVFKLLYIVLDRTQEILLASIIGYVILILLVA
ncbi:hypothetical protein Ple7327_3032 [Pleurocapsa sp. PCC 7327]|uniref:hypothetical protein n=1 Tax=Pleurocapsa sp. PCC 7327 TaxID=118163 RepID=UPI00029F82F8|nr:hypothetical protein [Pleurocapsa sp. PCC 7327]AFY78266.1 hypothetical protein Ple7327_3032 [Pleurocapsa sp. PCC 7327]